VKVLLDEMLPAGLANLLPRHEVTTVKQAGFTGLDNGELIRRAIGAGYTVLVTADRGLPAQRNIAASEIAVVLVPGSRLVDLQPRALEIDSAIRDANPATVTRLP
jgi:hypothetical protein